MFEWLFGGEKSKGVVHDITASQDRIAFLLARDVIDISDGEWGDREWVELAVNHELDLNGDLRTSTQAIVLNRGGTYTFSFKHEEPPRINGDLLHMPLKGYLQRNNAR